MMAELSAFTGLRGALEHDASLARYTSWRCGGRADQVYFPADRTDLGVFVRQLDPREPLTVIGLGSNLLVRDGGVRGTVIVLHTALNTLALVNGRIHAEAGVPSPKVARFAVVKALRAPTRGYSSTIISCPASLRRTGAWRHRGQR